MKQKLLYEKSTGRMNDDFYIFEFHIFYFPVIPVSPNTGKRRCLSVRKRAVFVFWLGCIGFSLEDFWF
jgi:hypothetical protein